MVWFFIFLSLLQILYINLNLLYWNFLFIVNHWLLHGSSLASNFCFSPCCGCRFCYWCGWKEGEERSSFHNLATSYCSPKPTIAAPLVPASMMISLKLTDFCSSKCLLDILICLWFIPSFVWVGKEEHVIPCFMLFLLIT